MAVEQKKIILAAKWGNDLVINQQRKEQIFTQAFHDQLGTVQPRDHTLNLDFLGIEAVNIESTEGLFSEDEVWEAIKEMPTDGAPGPDGFIDLLYIKTRPVI
jgi:hypothetical protein